MAALIRDKSGLLEGTGNNCHARAAHAQHLGEKFLGQRDILAVEKVTAAQQPPRQSRLEGMRRVACSRLLGLGEDGLVVTDEDGSQVDALRCSMTKLVGG